MDFDTKKGKRNYVIDWKFKIDKINLNQRFKAQYNFLHFIKIISMIINDHNIFKSFMIFPPLDFI